MLQFPSIVWMIVCIYLLIINGVALFQMWWDKRCAKKDARRIPEKNLFLSAILGGSIGAIVGMQWFRHKTKHWYFVVGLPAILVVQITLVLLLIFL